MASKTAVDYEDDETESSTAATATREPISSAAAKVAYKVLVCNAEKHGTGVSAYLTYEVRTEMMGGAFGQRDLSVRRRYADFVWLRSTLACNYLHALIPVLSDKEKLLSGRSHTAKHEARVMDARCRQLQSFMGQVCTHPSLSQSKDLLAFLEAKVFAIDASASLVPNINTASQLIWSLGRDAQRAGSLLLGQYSDGKPDPEHERNQAMQTFCGKFEEQGGLLLESFKKMSKRNQGIGQDLSEMSPVFEALGRAETHDPLAQALQRCASAAAEMSETYSEQASIDELATIEPIRDLVLLSTAAKDVLNNRDEAMVSILEIREAKARIARDLHKAQQDLDPSGPPKAKSAFALFKETMTLDKPEDVVKKLEAQKAECEAAATRAEKRCEQATAVAKREMLRFNDVRIAETKAALLAHARAQAEFHRKMQAHWDALLPQIECLEATEVSGGHGQHQGAFELVGSEAGTPSAAKAVDFNLAADGLDDLQP